MEEIGIEVADLGILTTPGIAWWTKHLGVGLGIIITASHNPPEYNGIKIVDGLGLKISPAEENLIEHYAGDGQFVGTRIAPPRQYVERAWITYGDYLMEKIPLPKKEIPLKVVFDGANGAGSKIGPYVLKKFGFEVIGLHNGPNGSNINVNCGVLHPESLIKETINQRAYLGIALDGDGDRVALINEYGKNIDGDQIIYSLAVDLLEKGQLKPKTVVGTIMSNHGLTLSLQKKGIAFERVDVGDRNVALKMRDLKAVLGGEPSGHIILSKIAATGDGLLTALAFLQAAMEWGMNPSELGMDYEPIPQSHIDLQINNKPSLAELKLLKSEIETISRELGNRGRVVVRYSGTESILRIMVEAPGKEVAKTYAQQLVQTARRSGL